MDGGTESKVQARRGFFPIVRGGEVSLTQGGAGLCISQGDIEITQGGGRTVLARGDVSIRQGGAFILGGGGNVTIREGGALLLAGGGTASVSQGGAAVVAAGSVRLERSYVGLALGVRTEIADDSKVLVGTRQAAIIGVAAGIACAVVARLLGGRGGGG